MATSTPPKQNGSPEQQQQQGHASPLSIVFSASWVKLEAPIGEGAFSRVYEGIYRNPETLEESVVAVKILKRSMLKRRSDCLRFIKEAKIMTKISHRHIAACYGIGKYEDDDPQNPGSLFIVQELIRGGNLLHKVYKQMLNRNKCIYTSQEALNWMMDVASGMQYLHAVSDNKPMIIHRDLKLENIMLSPGPNRIQAKLVDFGLHKVIDDRIKKVVKRVISEANLGGRLGRIRAAQAANNPEEDFDMDDELEAALAEQHAMVVASSVKPGVGPAALSPLGASPRASLVSREPPLRVNSRLSSIEVSSPSMSTMHEEVDEEEQAIREAQLAAAKARGEAPPPTSSGQHGFVANGLGSPLANGSSSPLRHVTGTIGAVTTTRHPLSNGTRPADEAPSSPTTHVPSANGDAGVTPAVAKIRAPVKKQSSMQKLMAKMKEIKLKVTGKDTAIPATSSNLGRTPTSSAPAQGSSTEPTSTSQSQPPQQSSATSGPTTPAAHLTQEERRARNVQLLDKIVAQQSVAAGEGKGSVLDDLGLIEAEGAARPRVRAPPRRAVTMINEIRYNLTEAVGSWAYMAPEVVLGQPYNEKVDVFSFGVILFEMLNRKLMLVDEIKNDPRKDAQAYAERVARGFRPEIPKAWPEGLSELICACWAQDPHCRPNFAAVVDALAELDAEGVVGKLDVRFMSAANAFI